MSSEGHHHIIKQRSHFFVLLALVTLTFISVLITESELGNLAMVGALLLAAIKALLVLWHFMQLKYESRLYIGIIGLVFFVFLAVIIVSFLDIGIQ